MWKIIFAVLTVASMFIGMDCSGKSMKIVEAWTHATPAGATSAEVYLTIQNRMGEPDTLIKATTYVAETATITTTTDVKGEHQPSPIPNLTIDADKDAILSANKTYILLEKLKQPLVAGEKFPLTLTFEKKGDVLEDVEIQPAGSIVYGGK
jgi:periplasmic copper chaperone A